MRLSNDDIIHMINKRLAKERELEKYEPQSLKLTPKDHLRQIITIVKGKAVTFSIVETNKK
ncbi:hypothetical protein [Bartonella sp. HY761]|uniref:hypothetical protein n=1 Tax=Bartonella sp. HY761 TaxID=2979330 RepID=UPI00220F18B0|nr:hypothetical protein [Bartonella sp. HY761]UXN05557.1 hypothetical protein N6A79_09635 [Bartonella sp. HY761]